MGKTKEMLIAMQEEMMMDWQHDMLTGLHEDLEVEEEMLVKLPTPSSITLSEPVIRPDIEHLVQDLYDTMLDFFVSKGNQENYMQIIRETLYHHGIHGCVYDIRDKPKQEP